MYYIEEHQPGLRLYHGTYKKHDIIDLSYAKLLKDFGRGYYLTSHFKQAEKWAKRLYTDICYVYEYKLSLIEHDLKILELLDYDENWLKYIAKNRTTSDPTPDYDIVYDRIADNRYPAMTQAIDKYVEGKISTRDALNMLKWKQPNSDQFCFKTEKAIRLLQRTKNITYTYEQSGTWTLDISYV